MTRATWAMACRTGSRTGGPRRAPGGDGAVGSPEPSLCLGELNKVGRWLLCTAVEVPGNNCQAINALALLKSSHELPQLLFCEEENLSYLSIHFECVRNGIFLVFSAYVYRADAWLIESYLANCRGILKTVTVNVVLKVCVLMTA